MSELTLDALGYAPCEAEIARRIHDLTHASVPRAAAQQPTAAQSQPEGNPMNASNDKIIDRIESAQRMLQQARTEHGRGNTEDATTFLEVAGARIKAAIDAIHGNATVIQMPKGNGSAAHKTTGEFRS